MPFILIANATITARSYNNKGTGLLMDFEKGYDGVEKDKISFVL